jgi:hypothetical protein
LGISNCLQQHEYLRDTPIPIYKECVSCNNRTQFTCVRCGHCYSCHWKTERVERRIGTSAVLEKYSPPATRVIEQPLTGQTAMDVYGQLIEPICNYRRCNHRFSEHGNHKCKCHHALNYATGVSISSLI